MFLKIKIKFFNFKFFKKNQNLINLNNINLYYLEYLSSTITFPDLISFLNFLQIFYKSFNIFSNFYLLFHFN